jgi:Holliday junction resolvasome RuvABC endonuclease subunit
MVIAFDLSFTGTGWAAYGATGIETGLIKSNAADAPLDRMIAIAHAIYCCCHRSNPKLVVVEGFAYGRANQAHQMGGLGYTVRRKLQEAGFRWIEVAPKALKKFVSGNGNANKDVMLKNVYKRFGIDTDDNNIADAIGLLHIGMALEGLWEPTTAEQRAVIAQIDAGPRPKKRKKGTAHE